MERRSTYRRPIRYDGDFVFVPPSVVAIEFNKTRVTMMNWCRSGYFIELGYRIRKEPKGQWLIGVPQDEFAKFDSRALALVSI